MPESIDFICRIELLNCTQICCPQQIKSAQFDVPPQQIVRPLQRVDLYARQDGLILTARAKRLFLRIVLECQLSSRHLQYLHPKIRMIRISLLQPGFQ